MVPYRSLLVAGCAWAAAAAAVWPHTSFSGAGAEQPAALIEALARGLSPSLKPSCRNDLAAFAGQRLRALIAAGYPSSIRFSDEARRAGERYLDGRCPAGPFLAASSIAAESAATVRRGNGARPLYATP